MGVLSDVIVASDADAAAVLDTDGQARPWPWADMKGIEHVKLGRLEAAFRQGPYDPAFVEACELLVASDDESAWVFRIPTVLTDHLANADAGRVKSLARRWAAAEEFALDRWQPETVEAALVELTRLARLARATGKELLLWMSL